MRIHRIAALAAVFVSAAAGGAGAQTCGLSLMASLDMTVLPNGLVAVPVTVDGTPHEFTVETAGVFSSISAAAAQALGLKETQAAYEMYSVQGKRKLNAATISSFKVGNNEAKNFHIAVYHDVKDGSDQKELTDAGIDGSLAPDFLSLFDVELDFSGKKVNLFSQDHCPGKVVYWTRGGYAELPLRFMNGSITPFFHMRLDMVLDGHDLVAALDTSSPNTWLRSRQAWRIFGIDQSQAGVVKSPLSSTALPMLRKQFGTLSLGGLAVQNPQIDILPDTEEDAFRMAHSEKSRDDPLYGSNLSPEDLSLGMNVLSKLHLFIAYKEHKIYVTAADQR